MGSSSAIPPRPLPRRPRDTAQLAKLALDMATGEGIYTHWGVYSIPGFGSSGAAQQRHLVPAPHVRGGQPPPAAPRRHLRAAAYHRLDSLQRDA